MKSLNQNPIIYENSEIFTPEILKWIKDEGFESAHNDSYCGSVDEIGSYESNCFRKHYTNHNSRYSVNVYVFSFGIGVDIDYDCGGNSSNCLWHFHIYSFEQAYDKMVDYLNYWLN
jgi:hypothetical protein